MTPQEFVNKWKYIDVKERTGYQQHFNDLCRVVGHKTPLEEDPKGEWFTFEAGAKKTAGSQGWADVWKRRHFGWEYKGKHADLDKAYQQLLQYRESLENPPLLIVSDMERIVIHTNFTNTVKRTYEIELEDILTPQGRDILRAAFYEPERLRAGETTEQVTKLAAQEFARLADILRKWDEEPQEIAHFLIRLLFCLFAEDIGLLPHGLFSRVIEQTGNSTVEFTGRIKDLFQRMATGGWFGSERIAYFNGGLFDDDFALELPSDGMRILTDVARLDWSSIEPSVLGTLFERSLDPDKRAQLGAHYTSKEDILLIVEPVLMQPLRDKWATVREQAETKVRQGDKEAARELLDDFSKELSDVQVADPACGSGNFLYVALRQLLNLEKEVITLARDLTGTDMRPRVSPAQLHGIELDHYAHELAEATVWIGYIQWMHENGFGVPSEPILKPLDTILHMDAILAYDEEGNPIEPEWPAADVMIGNPPFLGDKKMRSELGHKYVEDLRKLYGDRLPGQSDLVCYWFEKARAMIEAGKSERAGLLATQAIRGGANRTVLERIKETGDIFWAQSDRDWILEGASVHVSMVGFDRGEEQMRLLDGQEVDNINPDLTSLVDITKAEILSANTGLAYQGPVKVGPFDIEPQTAERLLSASGNPNGRPNSDVVRPWVNGSDVTRRPRGMYIIDFGDMSFDEAAQYEKPFEYVRQNVKPMRDKNRRARRREYWWQHGETVPALRAGMEEVDRYIITPRISKHRVFLWMTSDVLPDSATVAVLRDDDYFFGVLHSRPHELWALKKGTALEDRPRYTPTTTFETFPFPWPPGEESQDDPRVQAIAEAARELVEKRENWLNPDGVSRSELKKRTLTNLYNDYPTWLEMAHKKLDEAVLDAYGWPHDLTDEEILERLLAMNLGRAEQHGE